METTASLAPIGPVARPRLAAAHFLVAGERGPAVVVEAVAVAFAVRTDPAALGVHDLDPTALLLAR